MTSIQFNYEQKLIVFIFKLNYSCPYLTRKLTCAIPIVAGFLLLFILLVLFRTACSDPGILPRTEKDEVLYNEKQALILSKIHYNYI
jgi:hypothetical protein